MDNKWKDISTAPKDRVILCLWGSFPVATAWDKKPNKIYEKKGFWIFKRKVFIRTEFVERWSMLIPWKNNEWAWLVDYNFGIEQPTHWKELD